MARKINAVSPNESRLNGYFADPERRNTSNFRGISYEDERRADANEIYESGTKWVNEQLESGGGSGGGGAQPDWNAAEGEPGHIMNRPCYSEIENTTIYSGADLVPDPDAGAIIVGECIPITADKEYTVNWNGVNYTCTCITVDGSAFVLGNMAVDGGEDTGEPFCIITYGSQMMSAIIPLDGSASVTVTVTGELVTVYELDEKYIAQALKNSEERTQKKIDYAVAQMTAGTGLRSKIDIQLGHSQEILEGSYNICVNSRIATDCRFTILGHSYDAALLFYDYETLRVANFIFSGAPSTMTDPSDLYELRIMVTGSDTCMYYLRQLHSA